MPSSTVSDQEIHDGLDILQLNESIPAERRRLVSAGSRQHFVGVGCRRTEQMC